MATGAAGGANKPRRRNMRAADREQLILEEAVRFFAEHGFEGQTRELAKRMGITHSAIYRHFPSKESLIERVYEHIYLSRWSPAWAPLIRDRSLTLEARLTRFYLEYVERVFDHDWVRIFVFSGLRSFDITKRYLVIVRDEIIRPACEELRRELGIDLPAGTELTERELEMAWGLHGRIFYLAIRRFVYLTPTPERLDDVVRDAVRIHLAGAKALASADDRPWNAADNAT
ncbi:TetR/AcrR family transcriptional regulator [Phreatobacter sp.]|uniref:TetR/AcrR family transcriptional regulator n=1 Tax=Phreatobacter sp. TaxID=1966341 RepID=UPI003F90E2BC